MCGHKHTECLFPRVSSHTLHPGSAAKPQILPLHGWDAKGLAHFLEIPPNKKLLPPKWRSFAVRPLAVQGILFVLGSKGFNPLNRIQCQVSRQASVAPPIPSIPAMGGCTWPFPTLGTAAGPRLATARSARTPHAPGHCHCWAAAAPAAPSC